MQQEITEKGLFLEPLVPCVSRCDARGGEKETISLLWCHFSSWVLEPKSNIEEILDIVKLRSIL